MKTHELAFELWLSVLQEHGYNLFEVLAQLIQRLCLRMGAGESWHIAHKQAGLAVPFNNC